MTINTNKAHNNIQNTIRAYYTENFIRVYQAYSTPIGKTALDNQTFVSPPFKMTRMTWIKPSFLWMAYRAGWGMKDDGQKVILAIDITHEGFLWALSHACMSSFKEKYHDSHEQWLAQKEQSPVRIQWDPERDIHLNKLDYRAIQIGLSGEAVEHYVNDWIIKITDVSDLNAQIKSLVDTGKIEEAQALLPNERDYNFTEQLSNYLSKQPNQSTDMIKQIKQHIGLI